MIGSQMLKSECNIKMFVITALGNNIEQGMTNVVIA